jgi:dihydrofolate synthase/folylpolyglutamate synthase
MSYAAALAYLAKIQGETGKLALDNIRRVVELEPFAAGAARYVQVAGTNGKGSTSHYIAAILQRSGLRVGLFTSPHLQDVRERIRVNGRPVSKGDFARAIDEVRAQCEELLAAGRIANLPTFFETLFLAALRHFARRRVDWAVLEVGLGGRLDATSTVKPEVAVITNIALDHMDILGKTLAAIAREKAGIARPGVPLVCGCPPRSVGARVIRAAARASKAPLVEAFAPPRHLEVEKRRDGYECRYLVGARRDGHVSAWRDGPPVPLDRDVGAQLAPPVVGARRNGRAAAGEYRFLVPQRGRHQARNAALAVAAVDVLKERGLVEISAAAVRRGIRDMFIAARIEFLPGRPPVILDGGHNRAGIRVLVDYLREENIRGFTLLFGVLKDKQYPGMARLLAPLAANVVLCAPASERALPPEKLRRFFPGRKCRVERDLSRALAVAKKFKRTIIVCGSLYLVGGMRTIALGGEKNGRQKIQGYRTTL